MKYTVLHSSYNRCETMYFVVDENGYYGIQTPVGMFHEKTTPGFWSYVEEYFPREYEINPDAERDVEYTDEIYPSLNFVTG